MEMAHLVPWVIKKMVVFPSINPLGALGDALQWLYALQLLVELESRRFSMGRVKSSIFQKTGALTNRNSEFLFARKRNWQRIEFWPTDWRKLKQPTGVCRWFLQRKLDDFTKTQRFNLNNVGSQCWFKINSCSAAEDIIHWKTGSMDVPSRNFSHRKMQKLSNSQTVSHCQRMLQFRPFTSYKSVCSPHLWNDNPVYDPYL